MAAPAFTISARALKAIAAASTILVNPHFAQFYIFYYLFPLPFLISDWLISLWFLYLFPFIFYVFYVRCILKRKNLLKLEKKWRKWPFTVNILCIGILALYFYFSKNLVWGGKGLVFMLLLNILAFVITLYWRISLHMLGVASICALFLFHPDFSSNGLFGLLGFLLVLVIGWSRLYLRAHTLLQVIVGSLLGFLLTSFFLNYATF
ncbi:MAG: phosphatase PAP2 family protein [Bacteroidia bacterium]|nr:phosphatase PAP2 family protein [Bacteroidia bacterium]MDW8158700.1 phosphatase PAP2 family protein [Bacteroidia bacterium]